jgi:hypothetical protein
LARGALVVALLVFSRVAKADIPGVATAYADGVRVVITLETCHLPELAFMPIQAVQWGHAFHAYTEDRTGVVGLRGCWVSNDAGDGAYIAWDNGLTSAYRQRDFDFSVTQEEQ